MTSNYMIHAEFEMEKNRKAFLYTTAVCTALLLLFWLITWPKSAIPTPKMEDLIEVNLGNNSEGYGEEQPLIKGEMSPQQDPVPASPQASGAESAAAEDIAANDDTDPEAATVPKAVKADTKKTTPRETTVKPVKNTSTVSTPAPPKPRQPKFTYQGPGSGKGNGAAEDNGFTGQGNNPNGKGDAGDPSGKPDSYGNTPGGRSGGPKVIGNRYIQKSYSFTSNLEKAIVNASVRVSPLGIGTFVKLEKPFPPRAKDYENEIIQYLKKIEFNKSKEESTVIVQFNFKF